MSLGTSLGGIFILGFLVAATAQVVKYKYFDEYLLHLETRQQSILIVEEIEVAKVSTSLPLRTGIRRSKDEQCCTLGSLAGEKGYHCTARFYAARIMYRNYNRAQNKKITALIKGKRDPTAEKLMRSFEQCIAYRGNIFHKCCRYSALSSFWGSS